MKPIVDNIEKVMSALDDERYDWRSVKSIAEETGIVDTEVLSIIQIKKRDLVESTNTDDDGLHYYTTKTNYERRKGFGSRFFESLTGAA